MDKAYQKNDTKKSNMIIMKWKVPTSFHKVKAKTEISKLQVLCVEDNKRKITNNFKLHKIKNIETK